MNKESVFENESINKLIFMFSLPSICSLVLESLTSMIDTAFAGHLGELSADSLTAMGILSPVLAVLIAAQLVFGVSTSIVISKGLGENNKEKVNDAFKVGLYSSFVFSLSISLAIFIFKENILDIVGATGRVRELANEYLLISIIFNVFSSVGYTLVNNVRAFGYPKAEIFITCSATVINIVFNIVFTFGMDMGLRGIALATLISEVYYALSSAIFLISKKLWISRSKLEIYKVKSNLVSLVKIGFVQFLMQVLVSVGGFIINNRLMFYSGSLYIGVWAIVSKLHSVFLLPLIGLTQGVQSIIAYYQGNKNDDRRKETVDKTIKYSLLYSGLTTIAIMVFTKLVVSIFTSDSEIIYNSIPIVRIIFIGFPMMGIIYTFITFMQVSDREKDAIILGFSRQMGVYLPLLIILPIVVQSLGNSINITPEYAIFLATPIADIVSLFIGIYLMKKK